MLVEMAIGDAYGAAFEFVGHDFIARENDLSGYKLNPETGLGNGRYTDDTQMAIAVAEHLLSGEPADKVTLAARFLATFKRDPRPGYSKRLYSALQEATDAYAFLNAVKPVSTRNGASMRVSPIGLLPDIGHVKHLAETQASVTHDTPEGRMSAAAIAVMVHYMAYRIGPRSEVGRFIESQVPGHGWSESWAGEISIHGVPAAHAVIWLVSRATSLGELLQTAVALGGDTDTAAALSLFAGSLCADIAPDLPTVLYDSLESGSFGLAWLRELDAALLSLRVAV